MTPKAIRKRSKNQLAQPALFADLRTDVAALVHAHVRARTRNRWNDYEAFKWRLSRLCGWDAPMGRYDQQQFNAGIRVYLAATRGKGR